MNIRKLFENDNIYFNHNRRVIRALSPAWFALMLLQVIAVIAILAIIYCAIWVAATAF